MKKVFSIVLIMGTAFLQSCGSDDKKVAETTGYQQPTQTVVEQKVNTKEERTDNIAVARHIATAEEKAVAELCNCINNAMGKVNPRVRQIFIKAGNSKEPLMTLQTELQKVTNPEEQQQIADQFMAISADPQMQNCSESTRKKFGIDDNDNAAQNRVMRAAEKNKDCEVVYALMKIGIQTEGGRVGGIQ